MELINNSAKSEFDNLFGRLIDVVEQQRELRFTAGSPTELIEIKDRLHTLRSELATAREQLAPAISGRTGEVTRPGSRRRSAHQSPDPSSRPIDERARLLSGLHQPRTGASRAASSSSRP